MVKTTDYQDGMKSGNAHLLKCSFTHGDEYEQFVPNSCLLSGKNPANPLLLPPFYSIIPHYSTFFLYYSTILL